MSALTEWIFSFGLFLAGLVVCLLLIIAIVITIVSGVEKIKEVRKHDRIE